MIDSGKPAIVYLHGMAGGHLEREGGERVWLSGSHLLRGDVGEQLRAEGLSPAGHIRLFHRPAAFYWRRCGHSVHEFAYDWRQSLDESAARLRDFVAPLAGRFIFAGHSMGGCVALRWASLYCDVPPPPALLVGVPARGTFAAAEVLLGRFLLPRLVAAAAGPRKSKQALGDLRQAAAAMPGLVDLLPDPAVFPSAALLYRSENWPAEAAPEQALLDRSLALKPALAASPLLQSAGGTICMAARRWPTPCAVRLSAAGRIELSHQTGPGDSVVPFDSARGRTGSVEIAFPHAFQLWEPAVVRAPIRS